MVSNSYKKIVADKKLGSKKLPKVKLFFAVLALILLVIASKHIFITASAKPVVGINLITAPTVLGTQSSQNQALTTTNTSTTTSLTAPQTPTPTTAQNLIKITDTPTGYLNVRDQPSLDGNIIGKVYPGSTYSYNSQQNGWYLILLKSKLHGWIYGEYAVNAQQ